jgi:hypothetical protein
LSRYNIEEYFNIVYLTLQALILSESAGIIQGCPVLSNYIFDPGGSAYPGIPAMVQLDIDLLIL